MDNDIIDPLTVIKSQEETIKSQEKVIESLKVDLQEANDSATWWNNRYNAIAKQNDDNHKKLVKEQEKIERLNNILEGQKTEIKKSWKEINRLNKRVKEVEEAYLRTRHQYSELEGKYVIDEHIINELEKYLEEEKDRLAREISHIYENSLGKTRLVNEDIFNELILIQDKIMALKGDSSNE